MEESSRQQHTQERTLRAIEVVAISGFVKDISDLTESCLVLCNSCRECVPLPYVRVDLPVPSTLLAVFWPDLLCTQGDGGSRVVVPKRVAEVKWKFDDGVTKLPVESLVVDEEKGEPSKEEEEAEEEQKEKEIIDYEKVERRPATAHSIEMSKIRWPEGLRTIHLVSFDRPLNGVVWPKCLEVLALQIIPRNLRVVSIVHGSLGVFNRPLDGVVFPACLREIFLGEEFDQPIEGVAWPEGLERLTMPGFNQPIHDVQWPSGLKTLEFNHPGEFEHRELGDDSFWERQTRGFNQPLGTFLPVGLETLLLSDTFKQPLRGVVWPSGLAVLGFGTDTTEESIDGVSWPQSLRKLVFSDYFFDVVSAPPTCEVIFAEGDRYPDSEPDEFDMDPMYDVDESDDVVEYGDYDDFESDFSM